MLIKVDLGANFVKSMFEDHAQNFCWALPFYVQSFYA